MRELLLPLALEWLALQAGPALDVNETLGARSWRARQATAQALEAAWPFSERTLRRAEQSRDYEVADAARRIRERRVAGLVADAPWADWPLWSVTARTWDANRCPPLARAIRSRLPPHGNGAPCWSEFREVSRQWGIDALNAGLPPSLVRLWFAAGRAVDADYHRRAMPRD